MKPWTRRGTSKVNLLGLVLIVPRGGLNLGKFSIATLLTFLALAVHKLRKCIRKMKGLNHHRKFLVKPRVWKVSLLI